MVGGLTLDPSVSIGNLLTITFGCVALVLAWGKLGSRLDLMEFRVKAIEDTLRIMAEATKAIAHNERAIAENKSDVTLLRTQIVAIETDLATTNTILERLRKGEGWIQTRKGVPGVDREY